MWMIKVLRAFIPAMLGAGFGLILASLFATGDDPDDPDEEDTE